MINNRLDLVGQRFGKLTVIEYAGTKTYKNGNKFLTGSFPDSQSLLF